MINGVELPTGKALRQLLTKLANGEKITDCKTSLHTSDRNEICYRIRFTDDQLLLIWLPVEDEDGEAYLEHGDPMDI